MRHLNGNLLCAIDCETTGLEVGKHDIIQICVLPLAWDLKPHKKIPPFYTELQPRYPENVDQEAMSVSRSNLNTIMGRAQDSFVVADLFEKWFVKLNLGFEKRIVPLGHNWPFDREFIKEWLGEKSFSTYFFHQYRDLMAAIAFINDWSFMHGEPYSFNKLTLSWIIKALNIEKTTLHDALTDCVATAECYRRLMYSNSYMNINGELGKILAPHQQQYETIQETLERIIKKSPRE